MLLMWQVVANWLCHNTGPNFVLFYVFVYLLKICLFVYKVFRERGRERS